MGAPEPSFALGWAWSALHRKTAQTIVRQFYSVNLYWVCRRWRQSPGSWTTQRSRHHRCYHCFDLEAVEGDANLDGQRCRWQRGGGHEHDWRYEGVARPRE